MMAWRELYGTFDNFQGPVQGGNSVRTCHGSADDVSISCGEK